MTIELLGQATVDDAMFVVNALQTQKGDLTGPDASAQLARVSVLAAQLDAYRISLVATIRSSEVWRESDPNGTPASFLRNVHVMDHRQAKADLRTAAAFERFPELEQACRDGRVSREKVDAILSFGLRNKHREDALGEFLSIFVELAERVKISDLKRMLILWADQIDPVPPANDERDAHQRRELRIHQLGDGFKLDGFFGRDQGMQIMVALNAALELHRRENPDAKDAAKNDRERDEHGETTRMSSATAAQRADAFIESIIMPMFESSSFPTAGGAPANVCVFVPLNRLQHPSMAAEADEVEQRMADGTMRLHSATIRCTNGPGEMLISAAKAQQLSCDATVQRIVLSPAGKPLDIGRRTRVIPEQIRTALVVRDGGCAFPFCDKPSGWTEGHHIQHWSQGGPTCLDNLVLLCSRHHHQIHSEQIPIEFDQSGIPRVALEHRYRERL
ncbi:MAG: DUF222 domain-containing protein [Actinobacteria bacterium]|nr:DUF222 domain-containing protein [Actinomycetota bacterium]